MATILLLVGSGNDLDMWGSCILVEFEMWQLFGHATINGSDFAKWCNECGHFQFIGYKLIFSDAIYIVGYNILNYHVIW